jgi:hypothetical protein
MRPTRLSERAGHPSHDAFSAMRLEQPHKEHSMAVRTDRATNVNVGSRPARRTSERLSTETKQSSKTSEFVAMIVVIVGILISAAVIKGGDTDGTDEFVARHAWLYVSIVASAYFISRGLAKSGSRDPYFDGGTNANRDSEDR